MTYLTRENVSAFKPLHPFPIGTASERMPEQEFRQAFRHGQSTPLWAVKEYRVTKPIKIHIYSEGNLFFAENEALVVVGTGISAAEAIDDLCKHIIHFYQYYKRLSWSKVTGDAVRLKKIYESLFVESK